MMCQAKVDKSLHLPEEEGQCINVSSLHRNMTIKSVSIPDPEIYSQEPFGHNDISWTPNHHFDLPALAHACTVPTPPATWRPIATHKRHFGRLSRSPCPKRRRRHGHRTRRTCRRWSFGRSDRRPTGDHRSRSDQRAAREENNRLNLWINTFDWHFIITCITVVSCLAYQVLNVFLSAFLPTDNLYGNINFWIFKTVKHRMSPVNKQTIHFDRANQFF